MSTTNRITVTRNSISRATKQIQDQLDFVSTTLEIDINSSATVFVDVENYDFLDYSEIEILSVDIVKDGNPERGFNNIASLIRKELDQTVEFMNAEDKADSESFDYRLELSY